MPQPHLPTAASSTKLLLSMGTVPLLLVLVGSKVLAAVVQDLGQMTEEVFRGDRLPVLKVPQPATEDAKE